MTHHADKFVLRMPEGMRERIKLSATAAHRSMNAEIIYRLEAYARHADTITERDDRPVRRRILADFFGRGAAQ